MRRSFFTVLLTAMVLSGCQSLGSAFTNFGAPLKPPKPTGVAVTSTAEALSALKECSSIERTACDIDGSGFRGSTRAKSTNTGPAYTPYTSPPVSVTPLPQAPGQLQSQAYGPDYSYAASAYPSRSTMVLPPYGAYEQYYGYRYPYAPRSLYVPRMRYPYMYRRPFYDAYPGGVSVTFGGRLF